MPKRKSSKPKQTIAQNKKEQLTVTQIETDYITDLSNKYWSLDKSQNDLLPYDAKIVEKVYNQEISSGDSRRIMILEFSRYLENYLWPNFGEESTSAHVMSIIFLLNEKFRERIEVWKVFEKNSDNFALLFNEVLRKCLEKIDIVKATPANIREQTALLIFLNHCFNSMDVELCREQAKKLVSLSMWSCLQPKRRDQELNSIPEWKKFWKKLMKRDKPEMKEKLEFERHFLQNLIIKFLNILESIPEEGKINNEIVRYCERFLEFLIDLEALLPTRRFFNTVLDDSHIVVRCFIAPLTKRPEGKLFSQVSFKNYLLKQFYMLK
ncbi:CLUMA_CG005162, isoform A [Clunio marinus]|uniref:CLUMA_CG005162, isoform A n=1 Tax=Clunio marinus TaxID=568069 RepID=A0A1J1HTU8_9DIPT|nr:CLUMA_CG005162, isoform A [Clunio marinus]